ncbi:hypothetical protein [Ahniella affigens]|nr:hypothetical protein [Ahniella affigens]
MRCLTPRLTTLPCILTLAVAAWPIHANAQSLTWATFPAAPAYGNGNMTSPQTHTGSIPGAAIGAGNFSLQLMVTGGSNSWNGFGVAGNDDGYYSGPDQPIVGVTFVNGAPGFNNGIPNLAPIALTNGYNLAGAPPGSPAPDDNRQALYFDAGDGTTATATFNFATLTGGVLPTGSWLFLDGVDQGERVRVNGPIGWIGAIHAGDSSLPRPSSPFPLPISVTDPTFPTCRPAITQTTTQLELIGRYGDISVPVPTCSNVPVPVSGQTVGYTKGADSIGIWVQTAIDLNQLTIEAIDTDPSTSNGMGGFTGPDNNFVLGLGVISATRAAGTGNRPVPALNGLAMSALLLVLLGSGLWLNRRHVS